MLSLPECLFRFCFCFSREMSDEFDEAKEHFSFLECSDDTMDGDREKEEDVE